MRENGQASYAAGKEKACTGNAEWMPMQWEENKAQCFLRRCMCRVRADVCLLSLFSAQCSGPGLVPAGLDGGIRLPAGWRSLAVPTLCRLLAKYFPADGRRAHFRGGSCICCHAAFDPIYDLEAIYRGGEGWGVYGELMRFTSQTFDRTIFTAGTTTWAARHFLAVYFKLVHALGRRICFWQRQA